MPDTLTNGIDVMDMYFSPRRRLYEPEAKPFQVYNMRGGTILFGACSIFAP
jgi:hypothetical protein